jgi:hypothetical protein
VGVKKNNPARQEAITIYQKAQIGLQNRLEVTHVMSLGCLFLDPHLITHHLSIG